MNNQIDLLTYNMLGGFYMGFSDNFFKKVEDKTNVSKESILELANKIQKEDLKDEATLREVIKQVGQMAGKEVSKEKENKIIEAVINDKIPKDMDKLI